MREIRSYGSARGVPGNWHSYRNYVKLLGIILSPGNSMHFPDAIVTDPLFRRPALSLLFRPNSQIAAASLGGTSARTADAALGESVGQSDHTRPRIAEHALLT